MLVLIPVGPLDLSTTYAGSWGTAFFSKRLGQFPLEGQVGIVNRRQA
jgi:hypothetical protein